MTTDELNALQQWATRTSGVSIEYAKRCSTIHKLLRDHARLTALVQSLSDRCARQSELLGIRAERDDGYRLLIAEISTLPGCNCGAGTPFGPMAGHWRHCKINTNEEKQSS